MDANDSGIKQIRCNSYLKSISSKNKQNRLAMPMILSNATHAILYLQTPPQYNAVCLPPSSAPLPPNPSASLYKSNPLKNSSPSPFLLRSPQHHHTPRHPRRPPNTPHHHRRIPSRSHPTRTRASPQHIPTSHPHALAPATSTAVGATAFSRQITRRARGRALRARPHKRQRAGEEADGGGRG